MSDQADFLVELGTEELPPKALRRLELAFAEGIGSRLQDAGFAFGELTSFATPRRLAVLISSLQTELAPQAIEKRGPPTRIAFAEDGSPTRAATAFADGFGVSVDELERVVTDKGEWLVYKGQDEGQSAAALLPDIVAASLANLPVPKRMRWGSSDVEFVRPAHWLVMLLNDSVLNAQVLGIDSGNQSQGHRFHAPQPITITSPSQYATLLNENGRVVAAFPDRREKIRQVAVAAASELGGTVILEPAVLDEVTALVEWPVPVSGSFDPEFLRLPEEVLISTLQEHQRYFPVRADDGKLMANFIAISNIDSSDPAKVRQGNERVVTPRLSDAAFFWDQDRKQSLDSRRDAMRSVVFQKALGSLFDKSERITRIAAHLAEAFGASQDSVTRAAQLSKTDLLTSMVGEFPDLQGTIGHQYAELDGEKHDVAVAIEEQYLPVQAGGALPATPTGSVLAVADRLDALAGAFAINKRPSGNKDPFGLRRAALGLLRILIEGEIEIDLPSVLNFAIECQPVDDIDRGELARDLNSFILERARRYFLDGLAPNLPPGSVTPEVFEAVLACQPASPFDFYQRVLAVCRFMQLSAAESLAGANKRIANILKSADETIADSVEPGLFEADEEQALFAAIAKVTDQHQKDREARRYADILERLSGLKQPVDAFFDSVLVMSDDAPRRRNRITILHQLRQLFLDVADLSCIPSR